MKSVTISLDEDTYNRALLLATKRGATVPDLVKSVLAGLNSAGPNEAEGLKKRERTLRARIASFSAAHRISREAVHERDVRIGQ